MLLLSTIFTLNVRNSTNINLTKYLIIMKNLLTVLALMIGLCHAGTKRIPQQQNHLKRIGCK